MEAGRRRADKGGPNQPPWVAIRAAQSASCARPTSEFLAERERTGLDSVSACKPSAIDGAASLSFRINDGLRHRYGYPRK